MSKFRKFNIRGSDCEGGMYFSYSEENFEGKEETRYIYIDAEDANGNINIQAIPMYDFAKSYGEMRRYGIEGKSIDMHKLSVDAKYRDILLNLILDYNEVYRQFGEGTFIDEFIPPVPNKNEADTTIVIPRVFLARWKGQNEEEIRVAFEDIDRQAALDAIEQGEI